MRRASFAVTLLLLAVAICASIALVVFFDRVEHLSLVFLVPVMGTLAAAPIVVRLLRGNFDFFEIWVWYSFVFFLFYGVGAVLTLFVEGVAYDNHILPYLDISVLYCTIGLACCLLGYSISDRFVKPFVAGPGPRVGWVSLALLFTVGLVGQLIFAQYDVPILRKNIIISGLSSLLSQLWFLGTFAMFYSFYLFMTKRATPAIRLLLFGYMVPAMLYTLFLRVGNKTALILMVGLPFVAFWYARRRVPWKTLLVFALIVVFVVFPVYYMYRNVHGVHYSETVRLQQAMGILGKQQGSVYAANALASVARRVSIINSTAVIVRETGTTVEYQRGKTLWLGILVFIPRFVWPDKPNTTIGIWFGKTYHITGFGVSSFVTIGQVGELYMNFDIPGIIMGMLLMGFFMRSAYLRFGINGGANPVRLALYVTLMYTIVPESEGPIAGYFGTLVKETLILLALEKFLAIIDSRVRHGRGLPSGSAVPVRAAVH